MISTEMTSYSLKSVPLPVPELPEINLSHSLKQGHRKQSVKPPQLRPPRLMIKHDHSFNRSLGSSQIGAHAISFRENGNETSALLSPSYNKEANRSYYEQCFEQYEKLGEGSFGEVFKVRSRDDGRYYAIKKSKQFFRSEQYRSGSLEEVRRYEQFSDHEHCVTLFKAWEEDDRLFMQMELCQSSMEDYACEFASNNRQVPESDVWSFLVDLLLALKVLHEQNLIHLDIKLDNILITEDGICKLADFGLVFDLNRKDTDQATEGDSRYIAPEVLCGEFSKAADIFSLGVCVMELACNLELEPNGPLWQQLRNGQLPQEYLDKLSPALQSIIQWMMNPNPRQRPTVHDLLNHQNISKLVESRKKHWFRRKLRLWRRRAWRRLCAAAIKLLAIFTLVSNWFRLKPKRHTHDEFSMYSVDDDDSSLQITPTVNNISVPLTTPVARVYQSTPLNASGITCRQRLNREKINLSKTLLGFESSDEDEKSFSSDFRKINDSSNHSPNTSHESHVSRMSGKQLFSQPVSPVND